jgi:NitT/TauT family transport system substrate-binding protein
MEMALNRRQFIGKAGISMASTCGLLVAPQLTRAASGLATINIGIGPNLSGIDVHYAIARGLFKQAGLDVKLRMLTAGSQAIPQLLNGQLHFAHADVASAIMARARGLPILIAGQNIVGIPNLERGYANIVVPAKGPTQSLKDLTGQTIAVNQINGSAWALTRETLEKSGVDSRSVKFIEVPPQQLVSVLEQGHAGAAVMPEPLVSMALVQGMRILINVEAMTVPNVPVFALASSATWAKSNSTVVKRVAEIMNAVHRDLNADPKLAIQIARESTKVPPALLESVVFPRFGESAIRPDELQKFIDLCVKYSLIPREKVPSASSLLPAFAS